MTDGEKKLLELIQDYQYNSTRLAEIKEKLASKEYRITPSYRDTGGGTGCRTARSKVEDFAENLLKLHAAAEEYTKKISLADAALNCASLSSREKSLLAWIAGGGRLSTYAAQEGIYKSVVYKRRDKALSRAFEALQHGKTAKREKNMVKY